MSKINPTATSNEVSIQQQDFSLADEVALLEQDNAIDGAVVTFTGRVRNQNNGNHVTGLTLEHYPGMTEKTIIAIIATAKERWNIGRVKVIHRIGQLNIGEQIVFVGVTSKHRQDAFAANEFIMDFLKVKAPFWKKERVVTRTDSSNSTHETKINTKTDTKIETEQWLDAKDSDNNKAQTWS
ncbi:molybdopterin synthase catalytic subunit MoaE [Colwellia sp. D2M02]|uniref:molybdopterin synthase catalytic subunit MoaE n=1 Tax=Colwellia sp. D2M02 TaxID=2841562 RepID=UPI001C0A062C|nr:molybdopterin synthase catalytic subunit MoaE [Colwellia sp. D2M02]MBU2893325.1 molybdopterin synthase catalytic subunit MoaE [Colwellia sp. D2M02]